MSKITARIFGSLPGLLNRSLWLAGFLSVLLLIQICAQAQGYRTTAVAANGAHLRQTPAASAALDITGPGALAVDASGHVYIAVRDGIFKIDASGVPVRIAGKERQWRHSGDDGPALDATLNPRAIVADAAGDLYIADSANNRIRRLSPATGIITTIAGTGVRGFSGDNGPALAAQLDGPTGLAIDTAGNLYIADGTLDGHMRIRRISAATGIITSVAGTGSQGDSGDGGPAVSATYQSLGGMAVDSSGNLYIADTFNDRIRMISAATGIITTVPGSTQLSHPLDVAIDASSNLYIACQGDAAIRRLNLATGEMATLPNDFHAPRALALDAAGNLYIARAGTSGIATLPARTATSSLIPTDHAVAASHAAPPAGFKINVTYDNTVPAAAQTAFNSVISAYEKAFSSNITVNLDVNFGDTGLGESSTEEIVLDYSDWQAAMVASANANPANTALAAAAASLPAMNDPIGQGNVVLNTANARAIGLTANTAVDSTLTFSNSVTFEYTGVAADGSFDFMDVAAHELDEALGIGSALTGLADNAPIPTDQYAAEDYFRYSASNTRAITTSPSAAVYFSNNGGTTDLAQFNQAYSALGDDDLDRNDWIYGNFGCPAATPHVQDAIGCDGQVVPVGTGVEITVLNSLGYDSGYTLTVSEAGQGTVTSTDTLINCINGAGACSATYANGAPVTLNATPATGFTFSAWSGACTGANPCSLTINQNVTATATFLQNQTMMGFQTIAFAAVPTQIIGGPALTLNATATSGLAVTFASNSSSVCTVSGAAVTFVAAGTCSITASQSGSTTYLAANPVTVTFTIDPPFADLGDQTTNEQAAIDLLASRGITTGCSTTPFDYCSDQPVTRGEMAVFIVRSIYGSNNFPYTQTPYFTDVPLGAQFYQYIQKMRDLGITTGETNTTYGPNDTVTRGEMAVFIIRARYGAGVAFNYSPTPYFTDVPLGAQFFQYIQKLRDVNITSGETATTYGPNDPVTRGEMALFVMRGAFNLLLPTGTPVLSTVSPSTGTAGNTVTVTITGTNTNFALGTTMVTAGNAITVQNVTVNSTTSLTAQLVIASNATLGPVSIVATTGTEEAVAPNLFTITSDPTTGIVAYFTGNNTTLDTTSGQSGTLVNGATYASATSRTQGLQDAQAFSLNGTNSYVQAASSETTTISGARTLIAWVYPNPTTGLGQPVLTAADIFGITGATGTCSSNGQYQLYIDHGGTCYVSDISLTPAAWSLVAITFDGSNVVFYINGVASVTVPQAQMSNLVLSTLEIGGNTFGGASTGPSFNGLLSEVQIYNRALTPAEIQGIYAP